MNTNQKGIKGLLQVMLDASNKGWHCYLPVDDFSPVDIILMNTAGKVLRLQVKYRSKMINKIAERYELSARSIINGSAIHINRDIIDGWALYLSDRDKVKYIPIDAMKNNTTMNINPDTDYGSLENL